MMRSNNPLLIQIGQNIRNERRHKKIPLKQMALLTGIDLSNLSLIENGMRNFHILTLQTIADVLEIDMKELI